MGLLLKTWKRPQNLGPLFTTEKLQKKAFLSIKGKIEEETLNETKKKKTKIILVDKDKIVNINTHW